MPRRSHIFPVSEHDTFILHKFPTIEHYEINKLEVERAQALHRQYCAEIGGILMQTDFPQFLAPGIITDMHVAATIFGQITFKRMNGHG